MAGSTSGDSGWSESTPALFPLTCWPGLLPVAAAATAVALALLPLEEPLGVSVMWTPEGREKVNKCRFRKKKKPFSESSASFLFSKN